MEGREAGSVKNITTLSNVVQIWKRKDAANYSGKGRTFKMWKTCPLVDILDQIGCPG